MTNAPTESPAPQNKADKPKWANAGAHKREPHKRRRLLARPGSSKKRSPQHIVTRLRQRKALELRLAGKTYEQIGKVLNVGKSQAERIIIAAMDATINEPAHRVFRMEMARLDALLEGRYEAACQGDDNAIYACLAVMRHRAQLLNWIGAGREPASARLTIEGGGNAQTLDISFHLPTTNGGQRRVEFDDLPHSPPAPPSSPTPSPAPSPAPNRIAYNPDTDITLDRVQPSQFQRIRGGFRWD